MLRPHFARRSHHQVPRLLVHREQGNVANVFRIGKEHDHAIDPRSDSAMGRCAVAERIQHPAEFGLDHLWPIARHLERLEHDVRAMVSDRAR